MSNVNNFILPTSSLFNVDKYNKSSNTDSTLLGWMPINKGSHIYMNIEKFTADIEKSEVLTVHCLAMVINANQGSRGMRVEFKLAECDFPVEVDPDYIDTTNSIEWIELIRAQHSFAYHAYMSPEWLAHMSVYSLLHKAGVNSSIPLLKYHTFETYIPIGEVGLNLDLLNKMPFIKTLELYYGITSELLLQAITSPTP